MSESTKWPLAIGDTVEVFNETLGGNPVREGRARITRFLDDPNENPVVTEVVFVDAKDPDLEAPVVRAISREAQNDPEAWLCALKQVLAEEREQTAEERTLAP